MKEYKRTTLDDSDRQHMKCDNRPLISVVALFIVLSGILLTQAQTPQQQGPPDKTKEYEKLVERGKYIVDDVAICSQCHTPRDSKGGPDQHRWLEGSAVWLQPPEPNSDWPLLAPRLAGNPPGSDAEMITLLTTGVWRDGTRLRPPMPQFRMTTQDAEAVVAYLKSLHSR